MKKIILAVSLVGALSSAAYAQNNDKTGFYVTGKIGTSITHMSKQKAEYIDGDDAADNESISKGSKNKSVFAGGVAFGYNFSQAFGLPIRAELDFTARGKAKANETFNIPGEPETIGVSNQLNINTVMANVYYDFTNESAFTPYVSAGIGYANVKQTVKLNATEQGKEVFNISKSHRSNNFAWSVGAGVQYALNSDLALDLSYRYVDAGKSKVTFREDNNSTTFKTRAKSHDIMLGITYNF